MAPPRTLASPRVEVPDHFYRDLVLSMRNGVVAIQADGTVTAIDNVACRILGLREDREHVGRPFARVFGREHEFTPILNSAFDLDHLPNRSELRLRGSGKVLGYTLSRIVDDDDQVMGAALFFKDLTQIEQLEERERLRDRLAALGEMAAAIAHEVKNPLAGIQVMAGLLKRQVPESPDAQTILTDIIQEAQSANRIVVDVLEFVHPINLQIERISVPDVLHDAIMKYEGQATDGDLEIETRFSENLPTVHGDHMQLRQLFTNLLINAFQALESCGRVVITAAFEPSDQDQQITGDRSDACGWLTVTVEDDGPGIPAEVTEKIFSPFFTTKPRGTGLGLAIVQKIIDAHDGRIDLRARPEGGTRFKVTLPVTGVADSSDAQESHNSAGRDGT